MNAPRRRCGRRAAGRGARAAGGHLGGPGAGPGHECRDADVRRGPSGAVSGVQPRRCGPPPRLRHLTCCLLPGFFFLSSTCETVVKVCVFHVCVCVCVRTGVTAAVQCSRCVNGTCIAAAAGFSFLFFLDVCLFAVCGNSVWTCLDFCVAMAAMSNGCSLTPGTSLSLPFLHSFGLSSCRRGGVHMWRRNTAYTWSACLRVCVSVRLCACCPMRGDGGC